MRSILRTIPDGNAGLQVKLRELRALVDAAKTDAGFRAQVLGLVRNVPERDFDGELAAASAAVRRLRYTRDPYGVELFADPRLLLSGSVPAGDCDDHTGLAAAILETLGHPTRFVVGGARGPGPDANWKHIWLQVRRPDGHWVEVDDTNKRQAPGWSPAPRFEVLAMSDGIGGFSLRKVLRKVDRAVVRPVTSRIPAPIKRVAAPVTRLARKVVHLTTAPTLRLTDLQVRAAGKLLRPVAGAIPAVANIVAPGAGIVAQPMIDRFYGWDRGGTPAPEPMPPPSPPAANAWPGSGDGGGSFFDPAGSAAPTERKLPPWVWVAGAAGVGLLAVAMLRRRR